MGIENEESSKEYNTESEQDVSFDRDFSLEIYDEFYQYYVNKEYNSALKALEAFQQKTSISALPIRQKYEYLDKAAAIYWANGETNQALELIDEAIELMPDEQNAYSTKASILETFARQAEKKGTDKNIIWQYRAEKRSVLQKRAEIAKGKTDVDMALAYDALAFSFFFDMPTNMEKAEYYAKSAVEIDTSCSPNSLIILKLFELSDALVNEDLSSAIDLLAKVSSEDWSANSFHVKVILTIIQSKSGDYTNTVNNGVPAIEFLGDNVDGSQEIIRGITVYDLWAAVENAYYILQDYEHEKELLNKMSEDDGQISGLPAGRALICEYKLNGLEAALLLEKQYADIPYNADNHLTYNAVKMSMANVYFEEVFRYLDPNTGKFLSGTSIESFRQISEYVLKMIEFLECVVDGYNDEFRHSVLQTGKEWLWQIALILYKGDRTDDQVEMEVNENYFAAKECILVLEKLSDFGVAHAQGLLGDIYAKGLNVTQDDDKAFNYFKLAYENGIDVNRNLVLMKLALYYNEGIVIEKDAQKALEYAKKATETGDKRAFTVLGQIYADSLGDIDQGIIWLHKGYVNGDEVAKNILLRLARENIDSFDDKIQFILDIHEKLEKDINALGSETVSDLGRKYVEYYMEIEKYFISPEDRLKFISVCLNAQADLVTTPGGIVSGDYFINQFEKLIAENRNIASEVAKKRQVASRISNLACVELIELGAAGKVINLNDLNWNKIMDYYFPKALELGWDGYYADGTGPWKPDSSSKSSKNIAPSNQIKKTGFAAMDAYDNVPASESNNGGCYIATAVYGSYDCPEVWTLRRYRDYRLAKKFWGRIFIRIYYAVSPTIVRRAGNNKWFNKIWRHKLDKMVKVLQDKGFDNTPYEDRNW